jgi:hypothetical protein
MILDKKERNKYVLFWEWKRYFFEQNKKNAAYPAAIKANILQQDLMNDILKDLYQFSNYNQYYWWEIVKIMLNQRKNAMYLYKETKK